MDFASIIGIIAGIGLVLLGYSMSGGIIGALWIPSAAVIVLGGCFGSLLVSYNFNYLKKLPKLLLEVYIKPKSTINQTIEYLISLSQTAKQNGLLSLEKIVYESEEKKKIDPFLKRGVLSVVDGTDPEKINEIMQNEIYVYEQDRNVLISMFDSLSAFAPAFGMAGTIIGMIQMLTAGIDDPNQLTKAIGVAFITTLYGVILANSVFIPSATKLRARLAVHRLEKEMIIDAVCAIRNGINPRMLREQLTSYMILDTKKLKDPKTKGTEDETKKQ